MLILKNYNKIYEIIYQNVQFLILDKNILFIFNYKLVIMRYDCLIRTNL